MKDTDYYADHTEEFEQLTDAEQQAVFDGDVVGEGDIKDNEPPVVESVIAEEPTLLAKDGVHTIPYSELVDARTKLSELTELNARQTALIASLEQAKQDDAGTGQTQAQDAVLAEYAGEFPEVAQDLKPYIQQLINQGVAARMVDIEARVAPVQSIIDQQHNDAILAVHPDAVDILAGKEFDQWLNSQPSFVKGPAEQVLQTGTPEQVNELFTAFKSANPQQPVATDVAAKAAEIVAGIKPKTPASFSDVPNAIAAPHDEFEAMRNMSSSQLEAKLAGKSPEEIERIISRLV